MKLTSIPQFARNLNRATEVVTILSKYGLADWLARLDGGVVKVQHPRIVERIRNDIEILTGLADQAEKYLEEIRPYQPKGIVHEFERTLTRELDFMRELRNLERFYKNFANDSTVRIPKPYP